MGFSKLFFCSLIFIVCISSLPIHSVAYVSINNITLLGDAYFQENGRICLTPYSPSPSPSSSIGVGRALYNHPIRFLDPSTNSNASFICRFSFYITAFSDSSSSSSPPLFGDGLTFIITSKKYILGSGFGYMGLSNETSQEEGGMYIAVEFDTSFDPSLDDISDNHIGIDINSARSFASVDSTSMGFDLKNGKRTTVWIEYIDSKKMVKVWLSYTKSRTIRPILATHIDLSMYLEEFMFIGFSASNGKGSAQHVVEKWRFRTYGFPHSVNCFEGGCFMCVPDDVLLNDTAETPSTRSRNNALAFEFARARFFVSVWLIIGGISWFFMRKKRNGTGNVSHQRYNTELNQVQDRVPQSKVRARKTPRPKSKREEFRFSTPTVALTDDEEKRLQEYLNNLNQCEANVKSLELSVSAAEKVFDSAKMKRVAAESNTCNSKA
ncbi:L-type lectin-domain containing receptor kinase S.6-like [Papaver somniferum]|uniref:L-type lectin-domain containing receptor kinase S.6-like n=1 Tax=Papaver somniferum TaxID=3469 RepID=UPI000E70604F|nr:L-type lectin-domain containing receptor kinase S.6-like [Papaver somniferum]